MISKDIFSLNSKVAVVTGGFGQLGRQYSMALVRQGAKVAIVDTVSAANKKVPEFEKYLKKKIIRSFLADITKREEVEKVLKNIQTIWGVPQILINNAGIDSPPNAPAAENGLFETYPESSLDKIIDVNLKGTWICCQVFGGEMAKHDKGSVINISSVYGVVSPNQDIYEYKRKNGNTWFKPAAYAVTKSAILNLTRYLAIYWVKRGVRVNTLTPAGIFNNQDKEFLREYCKRIPIGRMAREDEMNGPIIFLASDASSYMTGANLIVDGGWTAW